MALKGIVIKDSIGCEGNNNTIDVIDTAIEVVNSPNTKVNENLIGNRETLELIYQAQLLIKSNKSVCEKELGQKGYDRLLATISEIEPTKESKVDLLEKLTSIGANTLSIWPSIEALINKIFL
ncbi:TPA: hypothetical protein KEW38_004353 [Citrobacter braakii]|nr:hypothetical protein [Citrobacter braakii]HBC8731635.1 hypothetical protein [Citrobacter braakii]